MNIFQVHTDVYIYDLDGILLSAYTSLFANPLPVTIRVVSNFSNTIINNLFPSPLIFEHNAYFLRINFC